MNGILYYCKIHLLIYYFSTYLGSCLWEHHEVFSFVFTSHNCTATYTNALLIYLLFLKRNLLSWIVLFPRWSSLFIQKQTIYFIALYNIYIHYLYEKYCNGIIKINLSSALLSLWWSFYILKRASFFSTSPVYWNSKEQPSRVFTFLINGFNRLVFLSRRITGITS